MSNVRKLYKQIIDDIFGENVCHIDTISNDTNDVIGALAHEQFDNFTSAFKARLKRVAKIYHDNEKLRDSIRQAINQIADKNNWDGAYSELVVLDYFIEFTNTAAEHLSLDVTIPASDTLASEMGNSDANLDGYFSNFDIFFDTKVLSDKSRQIVNGVIKQVKEKIGISGVTILPSYNIDLSFEDFQNNRTNIYSELLGGINTSEKTAYIKSKVIDSLSYRLSWTPGVITGESEYSPLEHANNHHKLIFQHAKKFHRNKPTVIIFVNFPWFGEKIPPFDEVKESFYKNLCKSFFDGYGGKSSKGKEFNSKIRTNISAFDITKHLSAIFFFDDNSILSSAPDKNNITAFSFINNSAIHNIYDSEFYSFLSLNTTILNDFGD